MTTPKEEDFGLRETIGMVDIYVTPIGFTVVWPGAYKDHWVSLFEDIEEARTFATHAAWAAEYRLRREEKR